MPEKPDFQKPNYDKIIDQEIEKHAQEPQATEPVLDAPTAEKHEVLDYDRVDAIEEHVYDPKVVRGKSGTIAYYTNEGAKEGARNEDRIVINTEHDFFSVIDGIGEGDGYNAARILAEEIRQGMTEGASIDVITKRAQEHMHSIEDGLNARGGAHFALGKIIDSDLHVFSTGDVSVEVYDENGVFIDSGETDRQNMFYAGPGVGTSEIGTIHSKKITLKPGYRVLIMSDGVKDNVSEDFIKKSVAGQEPLAIANALQEEQLRRMREAEPLLAANREAKKAKKLNLLEYRKKQDEIYEKLGKPDHASLLVYEIKKPAASAPYIEPKETQTRVDIEVPNIVPNEEKSTKESGTEYTREQLDKLELTEDVQDYKEGMYQSWKKQIFDPAMPQGEDEIRAGFEAWWKLSKYKEIKFLISEGLIDNIENV